MLTITHLGKEYGSSKKAVEDINLEVKVGEIYGFIGHNGAGKTTTIKAVVGIMDFEEGTIHIDGHDVKKEPIVCKRKLAYIPDNPDLYEYLTGIQYLNFIADIFKMDQKTREDKIKRYAIKFDIEAQLGDLISSYSHGMKQKLALISAFMHAPKLLVLDEPFVGLDPKAALTLKVLMRELCNSGSGIFFSTHVLEVAEKLCDKIGIIKDGRMVAQGKTEELVKDSSLEEIFMEVINHDK